MISIRRGYLNGRTLNSLAEEYGVTNPAIGHVVKYKSWIHLPVYGPRRSTPSGRFERGVALRAKLTENDVRRIRRIGADGVQPRDIAAMYEVTPENIALILTRKTWKHVE